MNGIRRVVTGALSLTLLSCDNGPTALDVAKLTGGWELAVQAHPTCGAEAVERTIHLVLIGSAAPDGTLPVSGLWDFGAPTVYGYMVNGVFDPTERKVTLTLQHHTSATAMEFVGSIENNALVRGKYRAPSAVFEPTFDVGACDQSAVGRKESTGPL
jgi:hypothetical protein